MSTTFVRAGESIGSMSEVDEDSKRASLEKSPLEQAIGESHSYGELTVAATGPASKDAIVSSHNKQVRPSAKVCIFIGRERWLTIICHIRHPSL